MGVIEAAAISSVLRNENRGSAYSNIQSFITVVSLLAIVAASEPSTKLLTIAALAALNSRCHF